MTPYRFPGRTAVLTGAAGGIGMQPAHGLAARFDAVAAAVRAAHPGPSVTTHVTDLSGRAATVTRR